MINGLVIPPQGGDDDKKPRRVAPAEMQQWNRFLDFVDKKGLKGSPLLNKKDKNMGAELFAQFKKENPDVSINYDIVPLVQNEMQLLQKQARDFDARNGNPNSNTMEGISPVDGWFGSKTSQFRFPEMVKKNYNNGQLTSTQNQGLVGGDFQPVGLAGGIMRKVPKGKEIWKDNKGNSYYTDDEGNAVRVN